MDDAEDKEGGKGKQTKTSAKSHAYGSCLIRKKMQKGLKKALLYQENG